MDDLPHLIVDEPKRSKKALAAIIVVSLMILLIPAGVYLISQQTQLVPQAAAPQKSQVLENSLSLSAVSGQAALGGEVGVDILVQADSDSMNLVDTKIKFDPQALKVTKIATTSASKDYFATKWFESSFDNIQGQAVLVGGVPNPGIKTSPGQTLKLATVYFRPQRLGPVSISFEEDSGIYRNSDNINALKKLNNIEVNISEGLSLGPDKLKEDSASSDTLKPNPIFTLISPKGGEDYSYFKPLTIEWNLKDMDKIKTLTLLVNGEPFGEIASNFTNPSRYEWSPQTTLLLPYITLSNTYEIEVTGVSKKGEEIKIRSEGPFGILAREEIIFTLPGESPEGENFGITDASLLLSQFDKQLDQSRVDLNKDGGVNQLDLWLLRKLLLSKGIIK